MDKSCAMLMMFRVYQMIQENPQGGYMSTLSLNIKILKSLTCTLEKRYPIFSRKAAICDR